MDNRHKTHTNITHDVKKIIDERDIVLPSYYGKIYGEVSKKYNIELSPQELLHGAILDEKIVDYINSLSKHADSAIEAIQDKDEDKLQVILKETKTLQKEIEKLKFIAYKDTLTGCFNRRWFEENYLDDENSTFTVNLHMVFIDLNRLKRINDTFGHVVGDKVIRYLGLKLQETGNAVVRYGGDEFILIFESDDNTDKVTKTMKETHEFFSKVAFKHANTSFKVSFAYGISYCKKGALLSEALDKADKEMYKFKSGNRTDSA